MARASSSDNRAHFAKARRVPPLAAGRPGSIGESRPFGNDQGFSILHEIENNRADREEMKHMMQTLRAQFDTYQKAQDAKNQMLQGLGESAIMRCDDLSGALH
ncbi:hypothetical protein MMC07_009680 [Pseudocyphellaria aurata]|nr:hypothetical protein [Pseudocyphellaria aurata]